MHSLLFRGSLDARVGPSRVHLVFENLELAFCGEDVFERGVALRERFAERRLGVAQRFGVDFADVRTQSLF